MGVGWVLVAGSGNSPAGYSISWGLGGTPLPFSWPSVEILVDVDIDLSKVTVTIPRGGLGVAMYVAFRVSGSCTGCGGPVWNPTAVATARARRRACEQSALLSINRAINALSKNPALFWWTYSAIRR